MTHRLRRTASILASVLLTMTILAIVGAAPGATKEHPPLTVTGDGPVEAEFGPIPGNFPAAPTVVNWWPNECAFEAQAVCDTIPLDVVVPDVGPNDVLFMTVELTWDDPEGANDLDMYLWDDRQIQANQGDETPTYTEVNRSASADNPESLKQINPDLGRYNLTIVNWAGPNLGYKVKAYLTVAEFEAPFELLAPEFNRPAETPAEDEAVAPFDYSAEPPPSAGGPVPPTFGELPVQPDSELDFGPSDFEGAIAAPPPVRTGVATTRRPPRPVPGAIAAFWLGAVPLVLVGGALLLLARRRRDSLAYA